jgi:hypothetical protein
MVNDGFKFVSGQFINESKKKESGQNMSTKSIKITYWITTSIFCAMMAFSAFLYLSSSEIQGVFLHLGFPAYFRIELAIFKFAGVLVLLVPMAPARLKEWAYAGFFITLVSAFVAHISSGDGPDKFMAPVIFGLILAGSYMSYQKRLAK